MRVFYLFKWEIQEKGGYVGFCASPHLHENREPRGFSCKASFSHNKTNCCIENPSVSLRTGSWGLCASLLNLTLAGPSPSPRHPNGFRWEVAKATEAKGAKGGWAPWPHQREGASSWHSLPYVLDFPPHPSDFKAIARPLLQLTRNCPRRRLHPLGSEPGSSDRSCLRAVRAQGSFPAGVAAATAAPLLSALSLQ